MKLQFLAPVCAALLLAGCNSGPEEELSEEALSLDEVAAAAQDMDLTLAPGEYRTTTELLAFDLPGLPPEAQQMAERAFAEGAADGHTYCVTEEMTSESWLSQMSESDCTVSRFDDEGGSLNAVLQCSDPEGLNGRVEMTGIIAGDSADMEMRFTQEIPGMGDGAIALRLQSERIGDCS
jgi:hypothetical protein